MGYPIFGRNFSDLRGFKSRADRGARAASLRRAVVEALETRELFTVMWATFSAPNSNIVAGTSSNFGLYAISGGSSITGWNITWGDGQYSTIYGNPSSTSHTYTAAGSHIVNAVVYDGSTAGAPAYAPWGSGYSLTQSLSVAPPTFQIVPLSGLSMRAGQAFSGNIGVIDNFGGSPGNYSGTASIYNSSNLLGTYNLACTADNSGNLLLQISGTAPVAVGNFSVSMNVAESGNGFTATSSNSSQLSISPPSFNINPPSSLSISAGQPFTIGVINSYFGTSTDYSGTVSLNGQSYPLSCTSDGFGHLLLRAPTNAAAAVGSYSASVSVSDSVGGMQATASNTFQVSISPPPFSISSSVNLSLHAGQPFTANVGVINGYFGNAANYAGALSLDGYSIPLSFYADGSGNLVVQAAGTAPPATGTFSGLVSVNDSVGGLAVTSSCTLQASISSFNIAPSSNLSIQAGHSFNVIFGVIHPYFGNAGDYSGTVSFGGNSYTLSCISDGSGSLLLDASGSAPLTAGNCVGSLVVHESVYGAVVTSTNSIPLSISPASFTVSPPMNLIETSNQSFSAIVGTIVSFAGRLSDYSGTISINGNNYGLTFASSGFGNASVQAGNIQLPSGSYPAVVSVTDTVDNLSTNSSDSFSILSLDPLVAQNTAISSASLGVPWTGVVANFSDDPTFATSADFTASTTYTLNSYGWSSANDQISGAAPWWSVSDAETFASGGLLSANTTIGDIDGRIANAQGAVNVSLSPFSVTAMTPSALQGQSTTAMAIATLADAAGAHSIPGDYSATLSLNNQNYNVTMAPVSGSAGNYTLKADIPALPSGSMSGVLSIYDSGGGMSASLSTGVTVNVSAYNTLSFTPHAVEVQEGHSSIITLGSAFDSMGALSNSSTFQGSFVLNGQSYPLNFVPSTGNGNYTVQTTGFPSLPASATPYTGSISICDAGAGAPAAQSVQVIVDDAPLSISPITTTYATVGDAWTAALATFTDADPSPGLTAANYAATIGFGDGTALAAGLIGGGAGMWQVSGTHIYSEPGYYTTSISASDLNGGASASVNGSVLVKLAPLAVTANPPAPTENTPFIGPVGSIYADGDTNVPLDPADFSGTLTIAGSTQSPHITFTSIGDGGVRANVNGLTLPFGAYPATLVVTESSNGQTVTSSATCTIQVGDAPLAYIGGFQPPSIVEGTPFTATILHFGDADPSAAPDDYNVTISWGGGSSDTNDSNATIVADPTGGFDVIGTHTYNDQGTYTVVAAVTDKSGGNSISTPSNASPVTVTDAQIMANAAADQSTFTPGHSVTFTGTFTDANPYANPSVYSVSLTFTDSAVDHPTIAGVPNHPGEYTFTDTHTFTNINSAASAHGATLFVHDDGSSTAAYEINLPLTPPTLTANAINLAVGQSFDGHVGSIVTLPDPTSATGILAIDGRTYNATVAADGTITVSAATLSTDLSVGIYSGTLTVSQAGNPLGPWIVAINVNITPS